MAGAGMGLHRAGTQEKLQTHKFPPANGEGKGAQGEEGEGEDQKENAQRVSEPMAYRLSPQQSCLEQMGRDSLTSHRGGCWQWCCTSALQLCASAPLLLG